MPTVIPSKIRQNVESLPRERQVALWKMRNLISRQLAVGNRQSKPVSSWQSAITSLKLLIDCGLKTVD